MKRIWDFSKRDGGGGAPGSGTGTLAPPAPTGQPLPQPAPGPMQPGPMQPGPMGPGPMGPEAEPPDDEMPERYLARPIRPVAQLAVRVGLWGAVILGCLGGIRALVFPGGSTEEPIIPDIGNAGETLPPTVAGVAENAVEAWMTATQDDQEMLDRLFVEPPSANELDNSHIQLVDMRTVAGERIEDGTVTVGGGQEIEDGYWTVTVAVDLIETDPDAPPPSEEELAGEEEPDPILRWYVEVGIVGDSLGGLAAITTPGVVPAPPQADTRWEPDLGETYEPEADDALGQAIDGFLTALVAGEGDLDRYLSPDSDFIEAADPAPFSDIAVLELAWLEVDDEDIRVWALVQATTPTNTTRMVAYEIVVRERVDRFEVLSVYGSPTVRPIPEDADPNGPSEGGETTTTDGESTEDTTEDTSGDESSGSSDEGGSEPEGSPPPEESGESTDTSDTTIEMPAE